MPDHKRIIFFLFLCMISLLSFAQISTDRPSQSFGTTVIEAGRFQLESGFQMDVKNGQSTITYYAPQIRYGVNDFFELRLSSSLVEGSQLSYTPINFGFKSKLAEENGVLPELSFLGQIGLPSGSDEFKSQNVVPVFRIIANHSLGEKWSLGYNWGMDWTDVDTDVTNAWTLILGTSFSDKISWFGEAFGFVTDDDEEFGIDSGLTYLWTDELQLDVAGGAGLTVGLPDWYFTVGISFAVGGRE